jgi:hypothetical protein
VPGGRAAGPADRAGPPSKLVHIPRRADDAWLSQPEAARRLDTALFRIGALIACGHQAPAENPAGRAGVTITSTLAVAEGRTPTPEPAFAADSH